MIYLSVPLSDAAFGNHVSDASAGGNLGCRAWNQQRKRKKCFSLAYAKENYARGLR